MASKVEIVNLALGHLGQARTESLDLNTARDAVRRVLLFADSALDLVLGDRDWLGCTAIFVPNALDVTVPGWSKVYELPEKFVRMSEDFDAGCKWQVSVLIQGEEEKMVLFANGAIAKISAVIRVKWETLSVQLYNAVAYKMAELACVSVRGDDKLLAEFRAGYAAMVLDAARIEAFNHNDDEPAVDGFHMARRGAF